mgnify:FL=1
MLFRTLRRMIERNQIEGLEEKIVFFHDNKKLSDEDYKTLMKMLKEKQ